MNITLIAAMAKNRVIGYKNTMPWHCPADLAHFKALTLGKPVIMGRKTFESIGKLLPKRRNIVITRQDIEIAGCEVYASVEAALAATQEEPEVMIIGGATLYEQMLPHATTLQLTFLDLETEGDTFFPAWKEDEWKIIHEESHPSDANNTFKYTFAALYRK